MPDILIAPSLLAADFLDLRAAIDLINTSSADYLHIDVMDGRFVPNISFGFPILTAIRPLCQKPLDVHLMIVEPELYLDRFAEAGANIISVHWEACPNLHRTLGRIRELGCRAGVALNPHTPVANLRDVADLLDVVLVMSVNPGFGGQAFIPRTLDRVRQLRHLRAESGGRFLIEIDGGVTPANAPALIGAGADALVAGSAVFGAPDPAGAIRQLKHTRPPLV
jgi:ribulose-phosphate 3-epimerase